MLTRQSLEAYFEKFSTTTVIRVFNFIRTAPFFVERLFWIVVLLSFTSVTIWDVYRTIDRYIAEPTGSIVSFPIATAHRFPDATWNFAVHRERLIALYDNESLVDEIVTTFWATKDIVLYFREKLENIHKIDRFESMNYSRIGVTDAEINASLQSYYAKTSAQRFSDQEIALVGLTSAMLTALIRTETVTDQTHSSELFASKSMKKLYKLYTSKNTNFADLLLGIGELICVLEQVKIFAIRLDVDTGHSDLRIADVCGDSHLIWLGPGSGGTSDMIFYRFFDGNSPFVFETTFDRLTMTIQSGALYRGNNEGLLRIDLAGVMSARQQEPFKLQLNRGYDVVFSLETRSTSANLRRSRCQSLAEGRGIMFDCFIWCLSELIARECGCVPLTSSLATRFGEAPKGLKNCIEIADELDEIVYLKNEKCRRGLSTPSEVVNATCSQRCYRNCEIELFSSKIIANESLLAELNASTVVRLSSLKFIYQDVVEYKTMDERQLITSLGGNLSLYLGASFLALIHIFVFFVRLPFDIAGLCGVGASPTEQQLVHLASARIDTTG